MRPLAISNLMKPTNYRHLTNLGVISISCFRSATEEWQGKEGTDVPLGELRTYNTDEQLLHFTTKDCGHAVFPQHMCCQHTITPRVTLYVLANRLRKKQLGAQKENKNKRRRGSDWWRHSEDFGCQMIISFTFWQALVPYWNVGYWNLL